jgi:ABC-type sugar transport system substrate-binding protein
MKVRMKGLWAVCALIAALILFGAMLNPPAVLAQNKYRLVFLMYSAGTDPWNAVVQKGMADAAAQLSVDAIMLFIPKYDDAAAQVALLESTLQEKPDGIITTIINPTMFNGALEKALNMGIPVIASNTDALLETGDPLEHRIPYIGSSLLQGGYELARKAAKKTSPTRKRSGRWSAWKLPACTGRTKGPGARSSISKKRGSLSRSST